MAHPLREKTRMQVEQVRRFKAYCRSQQVKLSRLSSGRVEVCCDEPRMVAEGQRRTTIVQVADGLQSVVEALI